LESIGKPGIPETERDAIWQVCCNGISGGHGKVLICVDRAAVSCYTGSRKLYGWRTGGGF